MVKVDMSLAPHGKDSKVVLDGVDISSSVTEVEVHAGVDFVTQVIVSYVCTSEAADINGDFNVTHRCPLSYGEVVLVPDRDDETKARWHRVTDTFIDRGGVRRLRAGVNRDETPGE
jgi:hypothetical protein